MAVHYQQPQLVQGEEDNTKEDVERALEILKNILTVAETMVEDEEEEEEDEAAVSTLSHVQAVVDTLNSPLFSSLLEIRSQYLKETLNWQKGLQLSLDDEADLLTEFCQRYDITRRNSDSSSLSANITSDSYTEGSLSPTQITPLLSTSQQRRKQTTGVKGSSSEESMVLANYGAVMSEQQERNSSLSTNKLTSSADEDNPEAMTAVQAVAKLGGGGGGGRGYRNQKTKKKREGRARDYLLQLDNGREKEEDLFNLRDSGSSPSSDKREGNDPVCRYRHSSESSLSSYSVSSESSQHTHFLSPHIHKSPSTSPVSDVLEEIIVLENKHPLSHDLLYPLRDKPSQQRIHKTLCGQHGREKRQVRLTLPAGGIGLEVIGLSHMGLFVSELNAGGVAEQSGLLQVGDQILELNGVSCVDMASFELADHLESAPVGHQVVLTVQYNPSGFAEYLRQYSHQ